MNEADNNTWSQGPEHILVQLFFKRQKAPCQPNKMHLHAEFGPWAHQLMILL